MPTSARATATTVRPSSPLKKIANAGSATTSAATRNAKTAIALPSHSALRSHGASTSASKRPCSRSATNARVRPSSAVKINATHSSPSAATCPVPRGSAKWKIVSVAITKTSIDGSVSFARSSSSRSLRASAPTSAK